MMKIWVKLTAVVCVIMMGAAALGQSSHVTQLPGIDVELALDRTEVVVGEPVVLKITLTNTSDMPVQELRVNFQFAPGNGIELNIQPPGELPYRYLGTQEVGSYFSMPLRLGGNNPRTVDAMLLFDRIHDNGLLFSRPGTYMVEGNFQFNLASNPVPYVAQLPPTEVIVAEAAGDDAAVLELLDKPSILAAHVGAIVTTNTLERVTQAASEYPLTHLGALALRAEGLHYARSEDPEKRERGVGLLMKYLENGVIHTGADNVAWEIAAAYHQAKKYDLAREWVFWLVRNHPGTTTVQAADPLTSYYYLEPAAFTRNDPWYMVKEPWLVPNSKPPVSLRPRQPDAVGGM